LLVNFQEQRHGDENLRSFLGRNSNEQIRTILAGESFVAVERDLPFARAPIGVEG